MVWEARKPAHRDLPLSRSAPRSPRPQPWRRFPQLTAGLEKATRHREPAACSARRNTGRLQRAVCDRTSPGLPTDASAAAYGTPVLCSNLPLASCTEQQPTERGSAEDTQAERPHAIARSVAPGLDHKMKSVPPCSVETLCTLSGIHYHSAQAKLPFWPCAVPCFPLAPFNTQIVEVVPWITFVISPDALRRQLPLYDAQDREGLVVKDRLVAIAFSRSCVG